MNTRHSWIDRWAERLVVQAAHRAPASLVERLEEEWLADLAARDRPWARLRLALGCCWATRIIARELAAPALAAASSGGARVAVPVSSRFDPSYLSRRTTAILLIIALHVALIYGFASGLAQRVIAVIPPRISASISSDPHTRSPPPPLREPRLRDVVIVDPLLPLQIPTDDADDSTIHPLDPQPLAPPSPPAPPKVARRVIGAPGNGFPQPDEYYPPSSIRLSEEGVAIVRVCVDGTGRLSADPAIQQSSGTARLDAAALKVARAGSGHYRATTEDGRPVDDCYAFRVRFHIRD